jgi:hypothetical protein
MGAQSKHALLPPWGYAVAGATGAVLANAVVYPLDMSVHCTYIVAAIANRCIALKPSSKSKSKSAPP